MRGTKAILVLLAAAMAGGCGADGDDELDLSGVTEGLEADTAIVARHPDAAAVEGVVRTLFDHMRQGDAAAMSVLFHPDIRLVTTGSQDGAPTSRVVAASAWAQSVGSSERELDERLYEMEVRVAENLAMVWTEYSLFVDGTFSHCGVDLIDLIRTDEGWRIVQIADTRKQEGCRTS